MSAGTIFRSAGKIIGILLLLFFLLVFLGTVPFQFVGLLLFGWFGFLSRVLPQITFNLEIALEAVLALALALFGLHRILCWWARRGGDASVPAWRFGWTVKISVMVLLLFATSIAAVGIVHQIAWLCREPNLIVMLGRGVQTREMSDLKQVGTACLLYAADHEGRFPSQLSELVPDYLQDYSLFFTRAMDADTPQMIIYRPGYKETDNPETVVVASPRPFRSTRGGTRVVVYLDSSARVIPEPKFQEIMVQQGTSVPGR